MRTAKLLLTGLVTLALLSPLAMASEGEGGFLTAQPVALWGQLHLVGSDERLAVLEHQGEAGSLVADAQGVVVRVETLRRSSNGEEQSDVEEHAFGTASLRGEDGASIWMRVGQGTSLALGGGPAPQSRADMERMPDAFVMLQAQSAPEREPDACTRACASSAAAQAPLALTPLQPLTLGGRLDLMLQPGGALVVSSADGERRFEAGEREERRSTGGVALPLLGTVAAQEERVTVLTIVTVSGDQANVRVTPAPPTWDRMLADRGAPPGSAGSRDGGEAPPEATVLHAGEIALHLEGSLGLREATGGLEVAGERHQAHDADVLVGGVLDVSLATPPAHMDRSPLSLGASSRQEQSQLMVQLAGDVRSVDVASAGAEDSATLYQAAAVAGAAGAIGLLTLFAPAAKYGFSKVMAVPLYARLQRQELLDNRLRAQLLELIRREPGASPAELAKQLPCSWNNLVYHLSVLEREGYIARTREGRRWRFFPTGAQDHSALPALAALKNPRSARLIAEVRAQPGIAQHQLSARMALNPSTVHWHMERLTQAGLVRAERDGRVVRYYEGPAAQHLQHGPGEAAA